MKQKFNSGGRPPKINATTFRCSVNFSATEQAQLLTMQEKSGITSMSAFIKMHVFGNPFKVFVVDENTRIFIDKMSSLNAHYRTIAIDYDLLLKTLRENFTEKKAMAVLAKLERQTIEFVKTNRVLSPSPDSLTSNGTKRAKRISLLNNRKIRAYAANTCVTTFDFQSLYTTFLTNG